MAHVSDTERKNSPGAQARDKAARDKAAPAASKSARRDGAKKEADSPQGLARKVQELKEFFEEAKVELKKITWPSRKEAQATSIAVLVLTVVMAVFLGLTDMSLSKIVELLLS